MLKKICLAIILTAFIFSVNICHAGIPKNESSVGGIRIGSTMSQIVNSYGKPVQSVKKGYESIIYVLSYNDNPIFIRCDAGVMGTNSYDKQYVTDFIVIDESLEMPSGIHCGSTVQELVNTYGEPTRKQQGKTDEGIFTNYIYFEGGDYIIFEIHDGIIKLIEIRDMEVNHIF